MGRWGAADKSTWKQKNKHKGYRILQIIILKKVSATSHKIKWDFKLFSCKLCGRGVLQNVQEDRRHFSWMFMCCVWRWGLSCFPHVTLYSTAGATWFTQRTQGLVFEKGKRNVLFLNVHKQTQTRLRHTNGSIHKAFLISSGSAHSWTWHCLHSPGSLTGAEWRWWSTAKRWTNLLTHS